MHSYVGHISIAGGGGGWEEYFPKPVCTINMMSSCIDVITITAKILNSCCTTTTIREFVKHFYRLQVAEEKDKQYYNTYNWTLKPVQRPRGWTHNHISGNSVHLCTSSTVCQCLICLYLPALGVCLAVLEVKESVSSAEMNTDTAKRNASGLQWSYIIVWKHQGIGPHYYYCYFYWQLLSGKC